MPLRTPVARTPLDGFDMRRVKDWLERFDYKSTLALFATAIFLFTFCVGVANMAFINDTTRYSYALMSEMKDSVTLKMSDEQKGTSVLWKYDWYAGYDIAYHYAAKDTKVTFSSPIADWDCKIDGFSIGTIDTFMTTSSRVHEYQGFYYGDYLSFELLGGTPWEDYGGQNDVYISEQSFKEYCLAHGTQTIEDFLTSAPEIALCYDDASFTYHIVGVISDASIKQYTNVYGNFVFGSTKALTYNGFKEHYLDVTAFSYDIQGWEMEFAYLFGRVGDPSTGKCHYEFANRVDEIHQLEPNVTSRTTTWALIAIGGVGSLAMLFVVYKWCLRCKWTYGICVGLLSTFVLFASVIAFSNRLFNMLHVITDNHAVFFFFVGVVIALFILLSYIGFVRYPHRKLKVLRIKI